jgi:hypothetical protein
MKIFITIALAVCFSGNGDGGGRRQAARRRNESLLGEIDEDPRQLVAVCLS